MGVKDWSPSGRLPPLDSQQKAQLDNFIRDLAHDDQSYFQSLGLMLEEWVHEGRSLNEIANNLNGYLADTSAIVDHVHQILGTSRDD